MSSTSDLAPPTLAEAAKFSPQQVVDEVRLRLDLQQEVAGLRHQIAWFRRQVFGQKSEQCLIDGAPGQRSLGEVIDQGKAAAPADPGRPVAAHVRKAASKAAGAGAESLPIFHASPGCRWKSSNCPIRRWPASPPTNSRSSAPRKPTAWRSGRAAMWSSSTCGRWSSSSPAKRSPVRRHRPASSTAAALT